MGETVNLKAAEWESVTKIDKTQHLKTKAFHIKNCQKTQTCSWGKYKITRSVMHRIKVYNSLTCNKPLF